MCWRNVLTNETGECRSYAEIQRFFERTRGAFYIGHNVLKFDGPVLVRLAGVHLNSNNFIDTLVLSTLYNPSLDGGHSLDAWGERLGYPKIKFDNWSELTEEMVEYCHQDVLITTILFRRLIKTMVRIGFSEKSIEIQHKFTVLLERQRKNGFWFDGERAKKFYEELRTIENNLQDDIRRVFPPERVLVAERPMYRKDGNHTVLYGRDCERYVVEENLVAGSYRAYEDVEFNIGSPKQRTEKLLDLGWVPGPNDPVTKTGNPKPFEKGELAPSLQELVDERDIPEIALIAKWMVINGRANMINTWLNEWNVDTNCIHGKLFVADTLRLRHQAPNTANIPAVRTVTVDKGLPTEHEVVLYGEAGHYTYEARDLWTARPGRVLVGTDAAGLELRMLAHYINRPEFTKQVVEGDPHQYNADLAGVTRPRAKTLLYAIQYGAQAGKVASIIGGTKTDGARLREQFLERLGIKGVMDDAINEQKVGRVWLVDGSGVVCPSPHAALNYKLQGGGARVMAQAAIFLDGHVRRSGLDSLKVGDIHDEWQHDVAPDDAREYARLSVQSIREAGEELNLNVPLDGTPKIGRTWAETH